jgi:hypothetical protein
MAKHRRGKRPRDNRPHRTIEMVDHTGTAHLLSITAAETGLSRGRYTTLCAEQIQPTALAARMARYCRLCVPIPTQRSR